MTNEQTFKHKEPNQAITAKSKCTNRYLKSKSEIAKQSKQRYNKQRNYCVNLLRRKKQKYLI